jgi:hypothetical protein
MQRIVFVPFVWLSQQTAIVFLNIINRLVFGVCVVSVREDQKFYV